MNIGYRLVLTPWQPRIEVLTGVWIALIAAVWMRIHVKSHGFPVWTLLVNGGLYVMYFAITLAR